MANLVLKPSTGAGNSVIVKDQGGGAVLTTADSGATIANATLTTPTIASMANCTFPAGHIIQIREILSGVDESSNSQTYQDFMEDTITFTAGNKILAWGFFAYFLAGGGTDGGMFARLYNSTGSAVLVDVNAYINAPSGGNTEITAQQTLISKTAFSGTSVTIKLQYRGANGSTVYCGTKSRLLLMEVQA